ncbi:inverse autotransporter beta domain-containing protein, partial [Citrobacter werkmanii]|uniref:inverse autotransporter beta domain-containing protein n=1 Tax=Citrobacter werkmanii TaxID=67827 RepID=UPI0026556159
AVQQDAQAAATAAWATQAGSFFRNNPDGDAAADMATGMASQKASEEISQWLGRMGTARVQLDVDHDFSLKNSQLDLLIPVWEQGSHLAFTQGSIHRTNDRNQANLGFGWREFMPDYMLGVNSFFDYDLSRDHARTGLGLEYWRDYLKLSTNGYLRLTSWKDSPDIEDYEERPANGWDVRAEGYLPAYPQLGGKLVYEQYYGDKVGLFGNSEDDLQKNPYAVTFGLNYTPVPLVTFSVDQVQGKAGQNDTKFGLGVTYQPGVALSTQLDGDQVAVRRSLAGSRYDLVDRNNNIVLEYRKKQVIRLKTAALVSGYGREQKSLEVSVTSTHGLDHITWDDGGLVARGGQIVAEGGSQYSVILPDWKGGTGAVNNWTVRGVAYDKRGNSSEPAETQVSVLQSIISAANSTFLPATFVMESDGQDTQELTLTVKDTNGRPVQGLASDITLNTTESAIPAASTSSNARLMKVAAVAAAPAAASSVATSAFTEGAPGVYKVTVTAGTRQEQVVLTPVVQGVTLNTSRGLIGGTPAISNLVLSGTLSVGQALHATYLFDARSGEATDKSTYAWGEKGSTAASVSSGTSVTTSGTVPDYTLQSTDAGKVMEVSVQAKNAASPAVTGNTLTVSSTPDENGNNTDGGDDNGEVVNPTAVPSVSNLAITGTLEVGQSLSATYAFAANGGEGTDKSTYAWGEKGSTASAVTAGSSVTTSGTIPAYSLQSTDAGKVMEASVQAKNAASPPVTGNTLTVSSTPDESGNNTDGGDDNGAVVNPTAAPVISALAITGTLEVGKTLNATYTWSANGGEPTDKSTYAWGEKGSTAATVTAGSSIATSGTVPTYNIVQADTGKVMEVSVQAKNAEATPVTGNTLTVTSTPGDNGNNTDGGDDNGAVVDPTAAPQVSVLAVTGTLEVGQTLNATYTWSANGGEPTDKSTYAWGEKGSTAATVTAGSSIATSGIVPTYSIVQTDTGKVMEVSVQAKNGATTPVTGNILTVTSTPGENGNNTDGGDDNGAVVDPTAAPQVSVLAVTGTLEVGQTLNATYTWSANGGEPTDKSTYAWGEKGSTASAVTAGSSIVTSGTIPARLLVPADTGKVMEVSVQAKNAATTPVTGNTLTVSSTPGENGNNTDGGDTDGAVVNPTATPVISALAMTGTLEVGQTLNATYTWDANGGEPTDKSTYAWGEKGSTAAAVASGSSIATSGTVPTYTIVQADTGKVMEVSVQAKNAETTPVTGNTLTVTSTPGENGNNTDGGDDNGGVVDPTAVPQISALAITGTLEVGQALNGTYTWSANGGEPTDKSTYAWGEKGSTAAAVASGSSIATSGTVPTYTIVQADTGKVMEVSVQAKNAATVPVTGNTLTVSSTPAESGNNTDGGDDNGAVVDPTAAPVISALAITGTLEVGQALNGTYTWSANGGEPTDKSTYVWGEKGATASGVSGGGTITTSGTVPTYSIVQADTGKVMEVSVQAKNAATTPVTGNTLTVSSTPAENGNNTDGGDDNGAVVDPTAAPSVATLAMTGTLEMGQTLSATYAWSSNGGNTTDTSTYAWGKKGDTAAAVGSGSTIATSGTVPDYPLTITDVGNVMEVSVMARNNATPQITGNTLTVSSTPSENGNNTDGGNNGAVINPTPPVISGLDLSGILQPGNVLVANYDFDANGGDTINRSLYLWGYKGTTAANVATSGTQVDTFDGGIEGRTLTESDVGQVMELSVLARNLSMVTGNTLTVSSTPGDAGNHASQGDAEGRVIEAVAPSITNLTLTPLSGGAIYDGTDNANNGYRATYTFNANGTSSVDKSVYAWGYKDETAAAVTSSTDVVTTTGTVPNYQTKEADVGKIIELSVLPENGI